MNKKDLQNKVIKIAELVAENLVPLLTLGVFISLLCTWLFLQRTLPDFTVLKPAPSAKFEQMKFLCDNSMVFRANGVYLQNAGDTFGRVTNLKDYDYESVYNWLKFLESFDGRSNYTPAIASYYFGVTDVKSDLLYIMKFLEENYHNDPVHKWWWLYIAVHIANHKLQDYDKALELSKLLASTENDRIPKWAREMPAFILEKQGELEEALKVIKDIADNYEDFSQTEINFMNYFIKERLGFAKEKITKHSTYKDTKSIY